MREWLGSPASPPLPPGTPAPRAINHKTNGRTSVRSCVLCPLCPWACPPPRTGGMDNHLGINSIPGSCPGEPSQRFVRCLLRLILDLGISSASFYPLPCRVHLCVSLLAPLATANLAGSAVRRAWHDDSLCAAAPDPGVGADSDETGCTRVAPCPCYCMRDRSCA